ncbi:PLAC8 family protein [Phytophthora nicotianae]|nr:PLAC8 family protein [Phytophthora nicotianae]
MANQSLQSDEVLNVRWAFDDPNPVAKQAAERSDRDAIVAMMKAKGASTTEDAAFDYPEHYQMPATKRQRIEGDTVASYPDTDTQFNGKSTDPTEEELIAQLSYADPSGQGPAEPEGEENEDK